MGTREGRQAETSRKCPAWGTIKMAESLQMRGSKEGTILKKLSNGGYVNFEVSVKHLKEYIRK